jgi:hypothetical protein
MTLIQWLAAEGEAGVIARAVSRNVGFVMSPGAQKPRLHGFTCMIDDAGAAGPAVISGDSRTGSTR